MSGRILFASGNPGKLREIRAMLEPVGFTVLSPRDLGFRITVEETESSFAGNAVLKATAFRDLAGMTAMADDSGLVVDALGGQPGIYSARYGGIGASDDDRVRLVLDRLTGVPEPKRTARFIAAIALASPGEEPCVFEGAVEGLIGVEPRGDGGFGYDPIFYYPPAGRTFAEMEAWEKDRVSHRGRALRKAVAHLSGAR